MESSDISNKQISGKNTVDHYNRNNVRERREREGAIAKRDKKNLQLSLNRNLSEQQVQLHPSQAVGILYKTQTVDIQETTNNTINSYMQVDDDSLEVYNEVHNTSVITNIDNRANVDNSATNTLNQQQINQQQIINNVTQPNDFSSLQAFFQQQFDLLKQEISVLSSINNSLIKENTILKSHLNVTNSTMESIHTSAKASSRFASTPTTNTATYAQPLPRPTTPTGSSPDYRPESPEWTTHRNRSTSRPHGFDVQSHLGATVTRSNGISTAPSGIYARSKSSFAQRECKPGDWVEQPTNVGTSAIHRSRATTTTVVDGYCGNGQSNGSQPNACPQEQPGGAIDQLDDWGYTSKSDGSTKRIADRQPRFITRPKHDEAGASASIEIVGQPIRTGTP